jgi:magnesium transporter
VIVDCAAYEQGARSSGRLSIAEAGAWAARPGAFVWLGLRMPRREELNEACEAFGLANLDLDAVLAPHRRPVLTRESGVTWLVLRTATYDDLHELVTLGEISVLATADYVISIRHGQAAPLNDARREMEADTELLAEGSLAALLTIVTAVIDSYGPALDGFEKDAVEVEREVLSESRIRPIRRLLNLKRQVRELQLVIDALEDPLARLPRHRELGWTDAAIEDLEATITLLRRVAARTRTLSDLVNAAHEANLAMVSQQQNADMRMISAWVAIAAVPTMIAGIYGMNFEHMPELGSQAGYPGVLALMGTACLLLYRSFRRRGWL